MQDARNELGGGPLVMRSALSRLVWIGGSALFGDSGRAGCGDRQDVRDVGTLLSGASGRLSCAAPASVGCAARKRNRESFTRMAR